MCLTSANQALTWCQCDAKRPNCDQCITSRHQCPGYPEYRRQASRSRQQVARTGDMRHCRELAPAIAPSVVPSDSNQQIIPGSITTPLETRASCHFLSNYVLIPNKGSSAGFLEFILPLVQQNDTITHFKYAFDACALASLSTRVGAGKDLEKLALAQYTRALAAVSMALKDPGVAKLDASLAAVFLLGLFEHITAKHIMAWGMHIEGAVRLAGTGGDNQSSLRIAVQMQMVRPILVCCQCASG